jgi:hypothetical protein
MTVYNYSQLEGLWIQAGGPRSLAPTMAAIAEAESGGNSDARNPSGASGLWQILGNPFPGNAFDPQTNARMAVAKYRSQGLGAWVTFTSGAYKRFLQNSTTPSVPSGGKGGPGGSATKLNPSATTTAALVQQSADCLVTNPIAGIPFFGGPACLFSYSEARAIVGGLMLAAGTLLGLGGVAVLVAAAGMKAAPPLGKAAEAAGGALMLVPGAEGAGAGLMAAGRTAKNPAAEGRSRAAARERSQRRALGEPRENPGLQPRGSVRQSEGQARRERGAARARARRSAGGGRPASREETGF